MKMPGEKPHKPLVWQVYQVIQYLSQDHNISVEGLFRKHGNLRKQQVLKERLDLEEAKFTVHECATVLKNFFARLQEPILPDA